MIHMSPVAIKSDTSLEVDIESSLHDLDLLPGEHVEVDVINRAVTLTGEVFTPTMKYLAEYMVMTYPQVRNVENYIYIHTPPREARMEFSDGMLI